MTMWFMFRANPVITIKGAMHHQKSKKTDHGGPVRLILPVEESVKSFQHDGFVLVFQSLFHNHVSSWQVLVWVIEIQ